MVPLIWGEYNREKGRFMDGDDGDNAMSNDDEVLYLDVKTSPLRGFRSISGWSYIGEVLCVHVPYLLILLASASQSILIGQASKLLSPQMMSDEGTIGGGEGENLSRHLSPIFQVVMSPVVFLPSVWIARPLCGWCCDVFAVKGERLRPFLLSAALSTLISLSTLGCAVLRHFERKGNSDRFANTMITTLPSQQALGESALSVRGRLAVMVSIASIIFALGAIVAISEGILFRRTLPRSPRRFTPPSAQERGSRRRLRLSSSTTNAVWSGYFLSRGIGEIVGVAMSVSSCSPFSSSLHLGWLIGVVALPALLTLGWVCYYNETQLETGKVKLTLGDATPQVRYGSDGIPVVVSSDDTMPLLHNSAHMRHPEVLSAKTTRLDHHHQQCNLLSHRDMVFVIRNFWILGTVPIYSTMVAMTVSFLYNPVKASFVSTSLSNASAQIAAAAFTFSGILHFLIPQDRKASSSSSLSSPTTTASSSVIFNKFTYRFSLSLSAFTLVASGLFCMSRQLPSFLRGTLALTLHTTSWLVAAMALRTIAQGCCSPLRKTAFSQPSLSSFTASACLALPAMGQILSIVITTSVFPIAPSSRLTMASPNGDSDPQNQIFAGYSLCVAVLLMICFLPYIVLHLRYRLEEYLMNKTVAAVPLLFPFAITRTDAFVKRRVDPSDCLWMRLTGFWKDVRMEKEETSPASTSSTMTPCREDVHDGNDDEEEICVFAAKDVDQGEDFTPSQTIIPDCGCDSTGGNYSYASSLSSSPHSSYRSRSSSLSSSTSAEDHLQSTSHYTHTEDAPSYFSPLPIHQTKASPPSRGPPNPSNSRHPLSSPTSARSEVLHPSSESPQRHQRLHHPCKSIEKKNRKATEAFSLPSPSSSAAAAAFGHDDSWLLIDDPTPARQHTLPSHRSRMLA